MPPPVPEYVDTSCAYVHAMYPGVRTPSVRSISLPKLYFPPQLQGWLPLSNIQNPLTKRPAWVLRCDPSTEPVISCGVESLAAGSRTDTMWRSSKVCAR